MNRRPYMGAADARRVLDAARAEAQRHSLAVSIAIVDEAGILLALERLDGARLHTPEAAWFKARTAAIVRTSTRDLQAGIVDNPALLAFPGRLPLTGGQPLLHDGAVVGGIGSSGGAPEEDETVCRAALEAMAGLE